MRAMVAGVGISAVRRDRPVDQREEGEFVVRRIDADRIAGLQRGPLGEHLREAAQPGAADVVDLGVAGDDVGEVGRVDGMQRELVARLVGARRGCRAA